MSPLNSWYPFPTDTDFSIYNLPFGIFKPGRASARAGMAVGEEIMDLTILQELGFFDGIFLQDPSVFYADALNDFIALGKEATSAIRLRVQQLLLLENEELKSHPERSKVFFKQNAVQMLLPVRIGDYTDFYSSEQHATNVGSMFRDPANALLPNWKHLPVDAPAPTFGPSKQVDFELEMAFVVGKNSDLGEAISTGHAADYIFGFLLFNDWSARDLQKWEYVPLGPFLAKNFGSSVSPWLVTAEALEPFKVAGPKQEPEVLPYLQFSGLHHYDLNLSVSIAPKESAETVVCRSNYRHMYWNTVQQLAHHTVNGCNLRIGDLLASGTISGPEADSYGSMLELAWKGSKPLKLSDGSTRSFIHDHDTVVIRGWAEKEGMRVGFGEVRTEVLPSKD
jgi:fumarylacetoacetase